MVKGSDIFNNILTENEYAQIEKMVKDFNKDKSMELEVSFKNVNYSNYMRISEYYVDAVDEDNITAKDSLDISIILPDGNTYRISLFDSDQINNFIQKYSKTKIDDMIIYLLSLKPSDDIEIMFKDRGSADRLYIEDIATVFKLTKETPFTNQSKKPTLQGNEKLLFRYKNRYSFQINDNVRIDITDVKESSYIWNLSSRYSNYEIEMEVTNDKITVDSFLAEVFSVLKVVQDTQIPIGKKEAKNVLYEYQSLLGIKQPNHLEKRNVVSIESQHIIKFIANKYAITDKADGERYFLFVLNTGTYLLSMNLVVKKVDLEITDKKFHHMILDGELIKNENGNMFMAFDVVYANNIDYRYGTKYTLTHRLDALNKIIDECFGNLIEFTDYTKESNDLEMGKIRKFYSKELKNYWTKFWKALAKNKNLFVTRKLYFVPYGIDSSEVYMYADMVWKLSVYDKLTPYRLDGIIYTPINLPYMIKVNFDNLDAYPLEYKWKIPMQNSIDFYVKINTDADGNEAIYYDNSVVRGEGKPYKICGLFVGINKGGQEKPVPFKVNNVEQKANIYLSDGEARDSDGKIINNNTVVEFIFDNTKPDVDDQYKWIPLKTRYDKTESVQKYGKMYGNNLNIATRIWRTIVNPITEENIASLANPLTYQKEIDRLSKSVVGYTKPSFIYYQKNTANAAGMRAFNNWIKSNIILTYCLEKPSALDIGCGRGGDLLKFILAGIGEYVGIDIDNNGLYVINDSAFNRYKNLKHSHKHVPPMHFIQADAKGLFNVKSQESILPHMTSYNKKLMETYLSGNKKYSVINCQFTIHYYLSDALSWSNFCSNVNDHLEDNGYFLVTTFDGKLIYDKLMGKQKMTVAYTDNNGNKNIFFEINKIYSDNAKTDLGMAIDLYNSLISNQGTYIREYLVFPEFLEKSLKEKCGLTLVESDSFFNLFNLYKNYFTQEQTGEIALADTSEKRYNDIRNFYLSLDPSHTTTVDSDAAMASFKLSMLNRYYVFKKTKHIDIAEPSRIVGINHKINLGKVLTPYFSTNKMIIDPANRTSQINKLYHGIRKKYPNIKPSVYLVRHTIEEDNLENEVYRRNKLEFSRIRKGTDPKTLLIYKSPDKLFYPIYYQNITYDDSYDAYTQKRPKQAEGIYLLDSEKIVNDLDILVALSEKFSSSKSQ